MRSIASKWTSNYAAVQAAGNAAEMHEVLHAGIRYWLDRQKREEQRKAQVAKEAAARRTKLEVLIRQIGVAGPGGRRWTRDQEETVVVPFNILARAAANGQVMIRREGAGLAMATTEPHLRKFADMLDGTAEGRWALVRLADGGGSEVVGTASWAAYWSSAPRPSPLENARDDGVTAGRDPSHGDRGGNEKDGGQADGRRAIGGAPRRSRRR